MGEFISLSGVIGSNSEHVEEALRTYALTHGGKFLPQAGTTEDEEILVLKQGSSGITVMYPGEFFEWDDASAFLSSRLQVPVFSFHIHDGDLWMFILYVNGEPVARFNPIPDYWEEDISSGEIEMWRGEAEAVCSYVPSVQPGTISRYFVRWDLDNDDPGKAYPDDRFPYGDCWQLCDFMRRVALEYPLDETGNVTGTTFCFCVSESSQS